MGSGFACEVHTATDCAIAGGIGKGAGVCAADTCGGLAPLPTPTPVRTSTPTPTPEPAVCCVPNVAANVVDCVNRGPADCAALGGTSKGAGVCAVDSCADVPPPNASCADRCWAGFMQCLDGCTTTYCAPYCQVGLGYCLDACPP